MKNQETMQEENTKEIKDDFMDFDDEDDDDDDEDVQYKQNKNNENIIIIHKKYEEIEDYFDKMIEKTMQKQDIPFGRALLLLSRNSYDINKIQVITDEKLLDLIYPTQSKAIEEMANLKSCLLCFDDLDEENKYSLHCKHFFCKDCFCRYVQEVFREGQFCIFKSCPLDGCQEKLGKDEFKIFLDEEKYKVYKKFLIKDAFGNSENVISCPQPECPYIQMSLKNEMIKLLQRNITCECKHQYCNQCKEIGHYPCNCIDFRKWISKLESQGSSNLNDEWMIMNTKQCPKCKIQIEKNQGCMHMTCKQCHHHFCWICLGDWKGHNDYYKCSKFDQDKINEMEKEKMEISHFKFHSGQYQHHFSNIVVVEKEIQQIQNSINEINVQLRNNSQKPVDLLVINQYCQQILRGRQYLPFFYAKGFFITDKIKLKLFNDLIEDYARIIDNFNQSLDNLKDIIQSSENKKKIILKKSFYEFMDSLSRKLGSCQTYINQKVKQFTEDLDNFEKIANQKLQIYPVKSEAIFQKKQIKLDEKQIEKQKKLGEKQKIESEIEGKNSIQKQKPLETTSTSESDSDLLKKRKVQFSEGNISSTQIIEKQTKLQKTEQVSFDDQIEEIPLQKRENNLNSQESNIGKSQSVFIYRCISENAALICIDCGKNQATNEYGVCDTCFDSLNN